MSQPRPTLMLQLTVHLTFAFRFAAAFFHCRLAPSKDRPRQLASFSAIRVFVTNLYKVLLILG